MTDYMAVIYLELLIEEYLYGILDVCRVNTITSNILEKTNPESL